MAKKRRPNRGYKRPDFRAAAAAHDPSAGDLKAMRQNDAFESYRQNLEASQRLTRRPESRHPGGQYAESMQNLADLTTSRRRPKKVAVHKPAPALARASVLRPRYLVAGAAGAGAIGGAAYLVHRGRRRNTVKKGLVNPLTGDSVVFTKRYLEDDLDEAPRGVLVAKRQDESAVEHHGSRRSRKLPVVNVRVSGLPVQSARTSQGHTWERPGTSHANKLTHVRYNSKAPRTGKLYQLKHGRRSVSGSTVGKAAGFAQAGSSGRRILSAY